MNRLPVNSTLTLTVTIFRDIVDTPLASGERENVFFVRGHTDDGEFYQGLAEVKPETPHPLVDEKWVFSQREDDTFLDAVKAS